MLKLVDYEYYQNTYGGTSIPSASIFNQYSLKASSKVNYYTSNRIDADIMSQESLGDNIRNTTCEIAELLYSQDQLIAKLNSDTSIKASETVGPHSVSYVNKFSLQSQRILSNNELEKECYKICYINLVQTGLMYRGTF